MLEDPFPVRGIDHAVALRDTFMGQGEIVRDRGVDVPVNGIELDPAVVDQQDHVRIRSVVSPVVFPEDGIRHGA